MRNPQIYPHHVNGKFGAPIPQLGISMLDYVAIHCIHTDFAHLVSESKHITKEQAIADARYTYAKSFLSHRERHVK